jgi:hypothetical protein
MRLLKRIFGWNSGQADLIWGDEKQIAPQFTNEEEPSEESEILASSEIREARLENIDEAVADADHPETLITDTKTEVKLGGKTYIVEELTARDIKKLQGDWGKGKLKKLGIIK